MWSTVLAIFFFLSEVLSSFWCVAQLCASVYMRLVCTNVDAAFLMWVLVRGFTLYLEQSREILWWRFVT